MRRWNSATHSVACLPPAELLEVLPPAWRRDSEFRRLKRFEPSPYISVYHWLDRKITSKAFWAQVWNGTNLNCDFYDLSNIRPDLQQRPSLIASNIVHSVGLENRSDEDIGEITLREIGRFAPEALSARVLHRRVHRIPMAIPCPSPGTESLRPTSSTSFPGLLLAGDWTRTALPACMESAARSGFLAAEEILSRIGTPRRIATMPRPVEGLAALAHRFSAAARR